MRAATSTGVEKKNGGSSVLAADRHRGEHMPERDRDDRDEELQER